MLININDIPDDGIEKVFELPVDVPGGAGPAKARASIRIIKLGKRLLVQGSVKISASLLCSRCLGEYSCPMDLSFSEEYSPVTEKNDEGEYELSEEELDLAFYRDDEINLADVVKEQVILSIPIKPLCNENCRGICPVCGNNRNKGDCSCESEKTDPRLSPLLKLKEKMKKRGS